MAKVTYKPQSPEDAKTVKMSGYDFEDGKSVDVTNTADLAKFHANPWFEVSGWEPKEGQVEEPSSRTNPPDAPVISIANQTYASQPPGVGAKTMGVPREVGSAEALIDTYGEDVALEKAEATVEALQARKRGPGRPPKAKSDDAAPVHFKSKG